MTRWTLRREPPATDRLDDVVPGAWLDQLRATGPAAFEDEVTPDRLDRQRRRIVRRLDRVVSPPRTSRVLRFPSTAHARLRQAPGATRWMGAAAAGLVLGLGLGQFADPVRPGSQGADARREPVSPMVAAMGPGDGAVLDEVDQVLASIRVPELSHLDEITPRTREVSVNPW